MAKSLKTKLTDDTVTDAQIREVKLDAATPEDIRNACTGALIAGWGREEARRAHRAKIAEYLNTRQVPK